MKIGVVVGTFDLFHTGHLKLLVNANNNCDYLIVGVNKDCVVMRDKHKCPVISENDRMAIIASIFCVNEVHLVCDNAVQFIRDMLHSGKDIDVYFRGNEDNRPSVVAENALIESMGVRVMQFPYTPNISTSIIRHKLSTQS